MQVYRCGKQQMYVIQVYIIVWLCAYICVGSSGTSNECGRLDEKAITSSRGQMTVRPFTHPFILSFTLSLIHPFILSLTLSFIHPFILLLTLSFIHQLIYPFIHSLDLSFINPLIQLIFDWLIDSH